MAVRINHTFTNDLDMFLVSPDNALLPVELATDVGTSGMNYGLGAADPCNGSTVYTVFDDSAAVSINAGAPGALSPFAGAFKPEGTLSDFIGISQQGAWSLRITDDFTGSAPAAVLCWELRITVDNDDDGLTDGEEVNTYGTFPLQPDTDDDGLTDGEEVGIWVTDPNDADTDDDGISDGDEANGDSSPTDPCNPFSCQADVLVKKPKAPFVGDGVINNDGTDQTVQKGAKRGKKVVYKLRFESSAVAPDGVRVTGDGGGGGFKVKYVYEGQNVTGLVIAGGFVDDSPLSDMRLEVTPKTSVAKGTTRQVFVTGESELAVVGADTVKVVTKAK